MPFVARIAIGLSVALGAAGCAALSEAQMDPGVREKLGQGPPIHVWHWVPKPLTSVITAYESHHVYDLPGVDDPVAEVERAFLDALRAELGLSNLQPSDRPMWSQRRMLSEGVTWEYACANHGIPMTRLPAEWSRDLVLSLSTLDWSLDWSKQIFGECTLRYGLSALLWRPSDDKDLWRGFCQAQHARRCDELAAAEARLLKELRAEIARSCAAELVGSFMGRTERSSWDGTNRPKEAPK